MSESYIGLTIKELRKSKKITQKQLAEKIGKVESTVRMWELGKNKPQPDSLKKLAEVLEVDYLELMRAAGYLDEKSRLEKLASDFMRQIINIKEVIELINFNKQQIIKLNNLLKDHEEDSYILGQIKTTEKEIKMFKELLSDYISSKETIEQELENEKELINKKFNSLFENLNL